MPVVFKQPVISVLETKNFIPLYEYNFPSNQVFDQYSTSLSTGNLIIYHTFSGSAHVNHVEKFHKKLKLDGNAAEGPWGFTKILIEVLMQRTAISYWWENGIGRWYWENNGAKLHNE